MLLFFIIFLILVAIVWILPKIALAQNLFNKLRFNVWIWRLMLFWWRRLFYIFFLFKFLSLVLLELHVHNSDSPGLVINLETWIGPHTLWKLLMERKLKLAACQLFVQNQVFLTFLWPFEVSIGKFFHPVRAFEVICFQLGHPASSDLLTHTLFFVRADRVLDVCFADTRPTFSHLLNDLLMSPSTPPLFFLLVLVVVKNQLEP